MSSEVNHSKIAHDVRNSLNTISMNAELGKLLLEKNSSKAEIIQAFNTIIEESMKASQVIAQLTD